MSDLFKLTPTEQIEILNELHNNQQLTVLDIADKFKTYSNKIRRLAKKLDFKIRDRSSAQALALKLGRAAHPTEGKERPIEVKKSIGKKIQNYWENLTPDELEERSKISKENWDKLSDTEKEYMHQLATKARLETAKHGSKLERAILEKLVEKGYKVDFHKEHSLLNEKLQLDLFIPALNVAIEIDGPTHFQDIWGEEYLKRTKKTDFEKDGYVLNTGCIMVRIKQKKDISLMLIEDLSEKLYKLLEEIKAKYPPVGSRKFIIE